MKIFKFNLNETKPRYGLKPFSLVKSAAKPLLTSYALTSIEICQIHTVRSSISRRIKITKSKSQKFQKYLYGNQKFDFLYF